MTFTSSIDLKLPLTDSEFLHLAQQNEHLRFESLATGELLIMPPTGGDSGWRNSEVNTSIGIWNRQNKLGKVFDSSTMFRLPNGARRCPDVAWVRLDRWEALTAREQKGIVPLCPDFVIELVSPTDDIEDIRAKMIEYVTCGTRLGWLIDPETRLVEIYRQGREKEELLEPESLSGEDVLPGFVLDLNPIFAS